MPSAVRTVASSPLVKTSWQGGDPNWGHIIDALGYSPAKVVEENGHRLQLRKFKIGSLESEARPADEGDVQATLRRRDAAIAFHIDIGSIGGKLWA